MCVLFSSFIRLWVVEYKHLADVYPLVISTWDSVTQWQIEMILKEIWKATLDELLENKKINKKKNKTVLHQNASW